MEGNPEIEALKLFIVKTYFKHHRIHHVDKIELILKKKENKIIKFFGLPKFLHTKYFLIASDGTANLRVKVPIQEKDTIKYFLSLIYKKK